MQIISTCQERLNVVVVVSGGGGQELLKGSLLVVSIFSLLRGPALPHGQDLAGSMHLAVAGRGDLTSMHILL